MNNLTEQQKGSLLAFVAVMFITPDSLFIRLSNVDTWGLVFYRGIIPFVTVLLGMLLIYKLNFFKMLLSFIKKHGHIMCQKFLPKIKFGDKRVFLINGKICGAISRVPKKGSFLSNMSKGAIPIATKLTRIETKISNLIAKDLKKNNIYFSGIDFIDQKLNGDINVTSPTGLKTFYDLTNINLAKNFWKGLGA